MRALLVVVALGVVLTGSSGVNAQAQPAARQVLRIDVARLHPSGDLRLTGRSAKRTLPFDLNRRWTPVAGSALHLLITHSPDLDPDRSFLSIAVNYGIVRSLRLDRLNATSTSIVVPIPPQLLQRENELQFVVEQHPKASAAGDAVWTTIGGASFVEVQGERRQPRMDLAELPDSFVEGSDGQHSIAALFPERPSSTTLEGTARLVATLAKEVLPGSLRIQVTRSVHPAVPLLIVGTPDEQPQLARLGTLPLAIRTEGGHLIATRASGETLDVHEGVVGLVDGAAARILFVTGNTAESVHRAATATLRTRMLAGPTATVVADGDTSPQAIRRWKGYIPPESSFRLQDIEPGNLRIPAHPDVPLIVPITVTPDARFFAYGHRVNLRLSVNAAYFTPQAKLRVEWNDLPLAEYTLADSLKGTVGSLPVWIPAEALKPRNVLKLQWVDAAAEDSGAAAAWLLSDTDFYLPRYYQADLPDLALLQSRLYPFSLHPDMHDVVIVLPDQISDAVFAGLLELSAAIGALAPADRVAFRVRRSSEMTDTEAMQSHLIALSSDESPVPLLVSLAARRPLLWKKSPRRDPLIQEMTSPWNADRYVLALMATSDAGLRRLLASALSASSLSTLRGDAAYLTQQGLVTQTVTPPQTIGAYSYLTASDAWLRTHWVALPAIVTLASGLLFAAYRLALRYRT